MVEAITVQGCRRCAQTGKLAYRTERSAKRHRPRTYHGRLRVYRCAFCGQWHLTSQERFQ